MSAVPLRFAAATLASHPDATEAGRVLDFLDRNSWSPPQGGHNVVIVGPVGTGKTGLAVGIVQWFREHRPQAMTAFIGVPDLLEQLRPPAGIEAMDRFRDAHVLVLDDLGAERLTDWARERLYVLVNHRWEWCLPTIVTTNLGVDGLNEHIGERMVSRLFDSAMIVALGGQDLRR